MRCRSKMISAIQAGFEGLRAYPDITLCRYQFGGGGVGWGGAERGRLLV